MDRSKSKRLENLGNIERCLGEGGYMLAWRGAPSARIRIGVRRVRRKWHQPVSHREERSMKFGISASRKEIASCSKLKLANLNVIEGSVSKLTKN